MITVGSVTREKAEGKFSFLREDFRGRRKAIHELTHGSPDFVFWIYPDGRIFDAKDGRLRNYPKGFQWILKDEMEYGGFLRGRVVTGSQGQLIVVYCRPEALALRREKSGSFSMACHECPSRSLKMLW